jgi:Icc-related predicted phosphoesterase
MKLLLFSDLHANADAARNLASLAPEADVLLGAGDFGNMRRDVAVCIRDLAEVDRPALVVPGNNESLEELEHACSRWPSARVLHGTGVKLNGVDFFGIGGGIPLTPFGSWSFDFTELEAEAMLRDCPPGAVLISHSPPYGTVDLSARGDHLGSKAIRDAVLRLKPRLVVCGHIHGSAGQTEYLGDTPVINAGPSGVFFEL